MLMFLHLSSIISRLGFTVEACTSRTLPDSKSAILLPPSHKSKTMLPRKRDTSQSHTKGPFSGPALTIMSVNVEGLSAAKEQLIADLRQRLQCAVVCIQETHRGPAPSGPAYQEWIWPSRGHTHNMAVPHLLRRALS